MIDRSLNYGRHHINDFVGSCGQLSRVLDVGAGSGIDLEIVRKKSPNAELYAIEAFTIFLERLQEKSIDACAIDIEHAPFPFEDEFFDLIIANQVLEHLKEIYWTLDNISRKLSVNGHLIIGVPNLASMHNRILLALGRQPTSIQNNSGHIRGYTKLDLINLLECGFPSGYKLIAFGGSNYYPFPKIIAQPLAKIFPGSAWGIFFLLKKVRPYEGSFLKYPIDKMLNTNFFVGNQNHLWHFEK